MENNQPIIIKRVRKGAAGGHGGAWKIAFADFATAMMAFFLVMWLMSSATPEQKKLISGYFQDPIGFSETASPYVIDLGGSPVPSPERTLNDQPKSAANEARTDIDKEQAESIAEEVERERLELLLQELQTKVDENPQMQNFKEQILFEITQDGLRIQIMDADNRPMFATGSAQLQPYFEDILLAMADTISAVPNKISISGHTDARPYSGLGGYGNWDLSADRANAARRVLVAGGYDDNQVARVVGFGSSALFDRDDPLNPINRRIDIVVLTKKAARAIEGEQSRSAPSKEPEKKVESGSSTQPLQKEQLREKLNIFEKGELKFE